MATSSEYMFLEQDANETNRLNAQQKFLLDLSDGELLLSSLVPSESLIRIADVGTGTGVWLKDLAQHLDASHATPCNTPPRQYHGYDMSDVQFPRDAGLNFSFTVHDILKPFPEQLRGSYDLVHVRLMVVALKTEQIPLALKNLHSLLKPGGWIQWTEISHASLVLEPASPRLAEIFNVFYDYTVQAGYARDCPRAVHAACAALARDGALGSVRLRSFSVAGRPELRAEARAQSRRILTALLPVAAARSDGRAAGGDWQRARETAARMLAEVDEILASGVYPVSTFGSVTAMRPLESSKENS